MVFCEGITTPLRLPQVAFKHYPAPPFSPRACTASFYDPQAPFFKIELILLLGFTVTWREHNYAFPSFIGSSLKHDSAPPFSSVDSLELSHFHHRRQPLQATGSTTLATRMSSATWKSWPICTSRTSRSCASAITSPWARAVRFSIPLYPATRKIFVCQNRLCNYCSYKLETEENHHRTVQFVWCPHLPVYTRNDGPLWWQ